MATGDDDLDVAGEPLDLLEDVRAEEHGAAVVAELAQQVHQVHALARVDAVERLVEQQHGRIVDERRGDLDPLPHALGVGVDPPGGRLDHVDHAEDPFASPRRRRAVGAGRRWRARTGARSGSRSSARAPAPGRSGGRRRCGARPARRRAVTVPDDGGRKPDIIAISVVLPAPLGPSRPVTPGPMVIVTSLTATTLPNQRETLSRTRVLIANPPSRSGVRAGRAQPAKTARATAR